MATKASSDVLNNVTIYPDTDAERIGNDALSRVTDGNTLGPLLSLPGGMLLVELKPKEAINNNTKYSPYFEVPFAYRVLEVYAYTFNVVTTLTADVEVQALATGGFTTILESAISLTADTESARTLPVSTSRVATGAGVATDRLRGKWVATGSGAISNTSIWVLLMRR